MDGDPEKYYGKPTDPRRFDEEDLQKRELSYKKAGFMLQFMLDTTLSDADKYPLRLRDLIVGHIPMDEAPMRLTWLPDPSRAISLDEAPPLGLKGDRYFQFHKASEETAKFSYRILAVDPSGRGKYETGYAVLYWLNGYVYVMEVGGLLGGYSDEVLIKLSNIAKKWNVSEVVVEGNFGDGMYCKLLQPILLSRHKASIEEVKSKGQKELRIIDTLEPVVTNHKLVVTPDCIRHDYDSVPEGDLKYACFYQFTRITSDRGALVHDDRLDALAIGVCYLVELMAVDPNEGIEEQHAEWVERGLESIYKQTTHVVGGVIVTEYDDDASSPFMSYIGDLGY